jgi:hypothetical protein
MNLYSGTSRLSGAGPRRMRPAAWRVMVEREGDRRMGRTTSRIPIPAHQLDSQRRATLAAPAYGPCTHRSRRSASRGRGSTSRGSRPRWGSARSPGACTRPAPPACRGRWRERRLSGLVVAIQRMPASASADAPVGVDRPFCVRLRVSQLRNVGSRHLRDLILGAVLDEDRLACATGVRVEDAGALVVGETRRSATRDAGRRFDPCWRQERTAPLDRHGLAGRDARQVHLRTSAEQRVGGMSGCADR